MAVCLIQPTAVTAVCSDPAHHTPMAVCLIPGDTQHRYFDQGPRVLKGTFAPD
jgi:hypothetical protein